MLCYTKRPQEIETLDTCSASQNRLIHADLRENFAEDAYVELYHCYVAMATFGKIGEPQSIRELLSRQWEIDVYGHAGTIGNSKVHWFNPFWNQRPVLDSTKHMSDGNEPAPNGKDMGPVLR